jgi:cysteine desulfurase/selenocysteine lyase
MTGDWDEIRREFPALEHWTYLNTATYGQMPRCAAEAIGSHIARRDELACSDFLDWFDDADRLRASIGRLVNCTADDIAFAGSASQALAVLLNGIDWRDGDEIVALEGEFPNNLYAPALVGSVRFAATSWDRFHETVTDRTRLVLMSTANYSTGFRPPIEAVADFLRERGILFYVDGTQSTGALRFDVARIRPAMFAVHGYKWLLCPTGAAFFYVDPALRSKLPPNVVGWRSDRGWRNVNALNQGAPELPDAAARYEGGMIPFALLCAMEASVDLLLEIGPERVERRVLELAAAVEKGAEQLGGVIANPGSHIIAVRFPNADAGALAAALKRDRIVVSARHGHVRISAHFYNNEQDIERLISGLRKLV